MDTQHKIKLLTIIIPAYNCKAFITNALSSIDYASHEKFEVLVVDDGSTTRWKHLINPWLKKYRGCVKYLCKTNSNWGGVINFGFKHAKGTFVKILDSDDEFVKEHFNDYLHNLQQCLKHNVDVVVNSYAFCIKNTNQIIKRKYSNNSKISFASLDKMRIFKLFTHHCITISKKLITKFKPLPIHCFYSDNDYIYQILLIGNKVALLPKWLSIYHYNIHDVNQSVHLDTLIKKINDIKTVFHSMLTVPLPKNISHRRALLLLKSIQSMFYLIMVCISFDEDLYHFQKKVQLATELSYLEVHANRKEFKSLVNIGYALLVKHFPKRIIFQLTRFICQTWPTGYLSIIRKFNT